MITAQDIQNKAIEIAKANPDFVYSDWMKTLDLPDEMDPETCVYFVDYKTPGCLYGRAMHELGIHSEYFFTTDKNDGVSIYSVVKSLMEEGLVKQEPFSLIYNGNGKENGRPLADQMLYIQREQDGGKAWGEILEQMEIE